MSAVRELTLLPELPHADDLAQAFPRHRFVCSRQMSDGAGVVLSSEADPVAIAYLLFTSGSTSGPKGVPISHANVRCYIDYVANRYDVSGRDRVSQEF